MKKLVMITIITVTLIILSNLCIFSVIKGDNIESKKQARFQGDIELLADNIKKDVVPNTGGEQAKVEYKVNIYNRGEENDKYDITEYNDHGFVVEIVPFRTAVIEPDNTEQISITIVVDNNAPASKIDYNTTVKVTSVNNHTKFNTITLKTRILQLYAVELRADQDKLRTGDEVKEGYRTVTFDVSILNLGTGSDTFKIELNGGLTDYATLSEKYFELDKKAKADFQVKINIPQNFRASFYEINVQAISRGDDAKYNKYDAEHEITLEIEVTRIYNVTLSASKIISAGDQGETERFSLTLRNFGNAEDNIELRLKDYDLNWSWELDKTKFTIKEYYESEKNEVVTSLSVKIPTGNHAFVGVYNVSIWVYSIGTPSGDLVQNNNKPLIFQVAVNPLYKLDFELDYPTSARDRGIKPGESLTHFFTLTNLGNVKDTYKLEMWGDKVEWFEPFKTEFTLLPLKSEKFNLTIQIPQLNNTNANEIEADEYRHKIQLTSINDPDVYREVNIYPEIIEVYNLTITTDITNRTNNQFIHTVNPNIRSQNSFSLTIKNIGNSVIDFDLIINEINDWSIKSYYPNPHYHLVVGGSATTIMEVQPPDYAKNGEFKIFTIQARLTDGKVITSYTFNATVKTGILEFGDIRIIGEKTPGSTVTVKMKVRNSGEVVAKHIDVEFYDKENRIYEQDIYKIESNSDFEIEFNYELTEGDHEIRATADWGDDEIVEKKKFEAKPPDLSWVAGLSIIIVMLILAIIIIIFMVYTKRKSRQCKQNEAAAAKFTQKEGELDLAKKHETPKIGSQTGIDKPVMEKSFGPTPPSHQEQYPYPYYQYSYPPSHPGYKHEGKYPPRNPPY